MAIALISILQAIKEKLITDAGFLADLKGEQAFNKIFIGSNMPSVFVCPYVQIVGMTDNYDQFYFAISTFRINVYMMGDTSGYAPAVDLGIMLNSIFDLLNEQPITVTGGEVVRLYAETRDAEPTKDLSAKGQPRYFQGISWRMLSI